MTTGSEVPQADRLDLRRLVAAMSAGAPSGAAARTARLTPRYGNYAAQAAHQLGLLDVKLDGNVAIYALASRLVVRALPREQCD